MSTTNVKFAYDNFDCQKNDCFQKPTTMTNYLLFDANSLAVASNTAIVLFIC